MCLHGCGLTQVKLRFDAWTCVYLCPTFGWIVSKLLTDCVQFCRDRMGECGPTQVKLEFNVWSPGWHLAFAERAAAEMPTQEEVD